MEHKRTGWEYIARMWQLDMRMTKVRINFYTFQLFHPIKAMFVVKKVNKTLKLIHEMKLAEAQKGYYI